MLNFSPVFHFTQRVQIVACDFQFCHLRLLKAATQTFSQVANLPSARPFTLLQKRVGIITARLGSVMCLELDRPVLFILQCLVCIFLGSGNTSSFSSFGQTAAQTGSK